MAVSKDIVALAVILAVTGCDTAGDGEKKTDVAAKATEAKKPEAPAGGANADAKPSTSSATSAKAQPPAPASATTSSAATPTPPAAPAVEQPPLGVGVEAREEHLGELKLGMPAARVKELLPDAKSKGKMTENEEAGQFEQIWEAPGVRVNMVSEKKNGEQTVEYITVTAPSTLKSARGVGIGDAVDAVKKAYGESPEPDLTDGDGDQLSYGGIVFTVKDGKVASIVIGEPSVEG